MKKLVWTISLAIAGIFLTARSAPLHWEWITLGAIFGGVIGWGFGSIFSCSETKKAIFYWAITLGTIGLVFGMEEPVTVLRSVRRSAYGILVGVLVGLASHFIQSHRTTRVGLKEDQ